MSKKIKQYSMLVFMVIGFLVLSGIVSAAITISDVELDDDSLGDGTNIIRDVERGDIFEVKVHVVADENLSDVQVEAYVRGYDHDDLVEDITDVFDMKSDVTYVKELELKFADRLDQGRYQLRVRVEGRDGSRQYEDYDLEIDTPRHSMVIKDIIVSPENEVKAGSILAVKARLKNYGEEDEESVKIKVSVPELGVSESEYLDEIDADDTETSDGIYLRVPSDTETGKYTVEVEVEYDDGDEEISDEVSINVKGQEETSEPVEEKTIITIGPDTQDAIIGGASITYPITITNTGATAKTYTIGAEGADWADFRISPSNVVVVGSGSAEAAYVFVTPKETASAGENTFTVTISSGDSVLQQAALKANVIGEEETATGLGGVKKGLEIGLVILVVLLVILGLIIGFNKLKGDEGDEEGSEDQTYY